MQGCHELAFPVIELERRRIRVEQQILIRIALDCGRLRRRPLVRQFLLVTRRRVVFSRRKVIDRSLVSVGAHGPQGVRIWKIFSR